jgi:tetratricopeptide (TPR) repeat protein
MLYSGLFYNRGLAHEEKGEYELAIADYSQPICIIEKNDLFLFSVAADAYCNRGLAHKALGQMNKAESDFAKLDRQNYGETIYRQGRKKRALYFNWIKYLTLPLYDRLLVVN